MKIKLVKSEWLDDWYLIEKAEHENKEWIEKTGDNCYSLRCSSRISDADVEGTSAEMLAIAGAIKKRGAVSFKRAAVNCMGDKVEFWSPRNSTTPGTVTLAEADELAKQIKAELGKKAKRKTR